MYLNDGFLGGKTIFHIPHRILSGERFENDQNLVEEDNSKGRNRKKMPSYLS